MNYPVYFQVWKTPVTAVNAEGQLDPDAEELAFESVDKDEAISFAQGVERFGFVGRVIKYDRVEA